MAILVNLVKYCRRQGSKWLIESPHNTNMSVSHPHKIVAYSVLEHTNTTGTHTVENAFHDYFACLNFEENTIKINIFNKKNLILNTSI